MAANNNFYKAILDNLHEGVYFTDRKRCITYWNHSAERITGYSAEEVVGSACYDNLLMHVNDEGLQLCGGHCPLMATMHDGQVRSAEVFLHHKNGHRVPVTVRASPIRDDRGRMIGAVETFIDNFPRLAALQKIERLQKEALLDPLTGLGNRRYTDITLQNSLEELHQHHLPFGVLFIDIDHFKQINDICGHEWGDRVLKMVACTLAGALNSYDFLGRWGGEEFVAILANASEERLLSCAEKLRVLVERSHLDYPGLAEEASFLRVTVSIGATLAQKGDTQCDLLRRADCLMYQSKGAGRNRVTWGASLAATPLDSGAVLGSGTLLDSGVGLNSGAALD